MGKDDDSFFKNNIVTDSYKGGRTVKVDARKRKMNNYHLTKGFSNFSLYCGSPEL